MKKHNRRHVNHHQTAEKQPLCEVNEKLPKQVKYMIRPLNSSSFITAVASFGNKEYEGDFPFFYPFQTIEV